MSYVDPAKPSWEPPARPSGGSKVPWILAGCGIFFVVGALLCGGLAYFGVRMGMQALDSLAEEFVAQGYKKEMHHIVDLRQSPTEKTVYVCQVLHVEADIDPDIAVVCQVMEVNATIHGDLDFVGQVLTVKSGGVIEGDLRIKNAQVVEIKGEVKGKISGSYMVLTYQGKKYTSGQWPTPAEGEESEKENATPAGTVADQDKVPGINAPPAPEPAQPAKPVEPAKPAEPPSPAEAPPPN